MITELTKEQKKLKKEVRDFWINTALHSGDEINRKDAEEGIKYIYKKAGLEEPKVLFVSSPMGVQIARNILNNKFKTVENEVENEVKNENWIESWREVEKETKNKVRNEVWNEVGYEVENEIWNEVVNEAGDEVMNEVGKIKLNFSNFNFQNLTTVGWVSFCDYFNRLNVYSEKTKRKFERYKKYLLSGVFFSAVFTDYAILSRRPLYCKKDDKGRLHSDNSPAIEWRDKYRIYAINGIRFKKELWEKIVKKTINAEEALKLENQEQRTIACQYLGGEKLMQELGGKVIDKGVFGELIKLNKIKDIGGNSYKYLKAIDPSKNEYVYLRTHPKVKTVEEAQAYSYKLDRFNINYAPIERT